MGVGITENNTKNFIFIYVTPWNDGGKIKKRPRKIDRKSSAEKVLSGEYLILLDVDKHV